MGSNAWRSPLSILMGARRNDDADLQLRDDHLLLSDHHNSSSHNNVPDSPIMATHAVDPSPGVVKTNPKGGNTTYFPFGFIYYSTNNKKDNNGEAKVEGGAAAGPPRGAFPPPISEHDDDIRREVNDINEYVASHPWYHQHRLMEEPDVNVNCDLPNDSGEGFDAELPMHKQKKHNSQSWQDQKAVLSTTFNFTNAIIGAGAMGLGGAFAASGGGISIVCLLSFAYLTKLSLDLIVELSSCPEIIGLVKEYNENEIGYESEAEEEEVEFDEEEADAGSDEDEYEPPVNDASADENNTSLDNQDQTVEQTTSEDAKDGDETAQITNKKDSSPLMAQEETAEACNLESNRNDSLNTPNIRLPLLNLDSDGNPVSTLEYTEAYPSNDEILQPCTYEELGRAAYGSKGRLAVLLSKCLYSFGCLVAYVVVVRDNFGPALRRMVSSDDSPAWLQDDDYLALWVSTLVMLPLSCPRTMEPLAKFSFVSVVSIMFLALSVVYLYFSCTDPVTSQATFYENWIEIRSFSGLFESLGTFVFTFVCHHVVNIAYESLPTKLRNPKTWRTVSTNSITMSTEASLAIGLFAYMTFGANTPADVLLAYPPDIALANISRLLLCLTMVLTFPLPFLTCREMLVLIMVDAHRLYYIHGLARFNIFARLLGCITILRRKLWTLLFKEKNNHSDLQVQLENENEEPDAAVEENFMEMQPPIPVRKRFTDWGKKLWIFNREDNHEWWNPAEPLLSYEEEESPLLDSSIGGLKGEAVNPSPLSSPEPSISSSEESYSEESISVVSVRVPAPKWLLKDDNGRQLSILWHAALTFGLWMLATMSAIKAPSLGDVLDLVGACTGTLLAFVLPAVFSFRLKGYSHVSCAILSIGGVVGVCGTISSLVKLIRDTHE